MRLWPAIAVDVICVLVFAIVGRTSHGEANDLLGVARTAWPFLAGALVGTLVGRIWRAPAALTSGLVVWLATVTVGLGLRYLSGGGVQPSFVIVAAIVLGLFLVGWRAGLRLVQHARARAQHHKAPV